MHNGMKLEEMLQEVVRHNTTKVDFITNTDEHLTMVNMPNEGYDNDLAVVIKKELGTASEGPLLERFAITENFHKQLASRLKVPSKYYFRLLEDHRELLMQNVNTLFRREPALRMVRTLDGKARAFLSRQYRRVDNEQILEKTLPIIRSEHDTALLNTYVDENVMRMKCLFTGDEHSIEIPTPRNGGTHTVHTGFEMGNSEVGKGSFFIRGFFYNSYCTNGCVFGMDQHTEFKQIHVGSRLGVDKGMLLSQETMEKEDELIISAAKDVLKNLSDPAFTQQLSDTIQKTQNGAKVQAAQPAVESICKELRLSDAESASVLESFIREGDYSQWGMSNAVTQLGNTTEQYTRSCKVEEYGNNILQMNANQWLRVANLEKVAA